MPACNSDYCLSYSYCPGEGEEEVSDFLTLGEPFINAQMNFIRQQTNQKSDNN